MKPRGNILIAAALAFWAAPLFAAPVSYREAAAPWSAEQAARLTPALTAEFLKEVKKGIGPAEAAALAEKRTKVSALLARFRDCSLGAADLKTAEKYFIPDFKDEVRFFAEGGCAAFKASAGGRQAAPRSDSLEGLKGVSASGAFATPEGSAGFFDGSVNAGAAPVQVKGGWSGYQAGRQAAAAASSKPLSSNVPAPRPDAPEVRKPQRPADLGKDGRVHQALAYWSALRRGNWAAYKTADSRSEKAKALLKAAAGATLGGLLYYSNLAQVETASARLGWDVGAGAGAGTIAWDATKLVFHSGVFALALAPVPMLKIAKAALAGEGWAIAMVSAIAAGPVNRYILHLL
ncbi:MAG: hypothetical protein HY550_07735 [Elusimicrobia bacterium]|nr:hypothetical protein [Elusimicrobiota bacterium]